MFMVCQNLKSIAQTVPEIFTLKLSICVLVNSPQNIVTFRWYPELTSLTYVHSNLLYYISLQYQLYNVFFL